MIDFGCIWQDVVVVERSVRMIMTYIALIAMIGFSCYLNIIWLSSRLRHVHHWQVPFMYLEIEKKHGGIENKVDLNKGDFRNETLYNYSVELNE